MTDDELMRRVQRGDLEQVGVLFRRHQAMVHAHCFRMTGSRTAADDLLQESFLRVIRFRTSWEDRARFSTWLYRIVRNTCLDYLRKARRVDATFTALSADPIDEESGGPDTSDELRRLSRALHLLPAERREVILLSRYMDMSYAEIGLVLGCTINNARVKLHRALAELKEIFDQLEEAQ